ncbi:MAG: phosphatase PAP2 family protein, partial [Lachnospiraceae bacterium]|nr:phosphatase PAP2 family protein [Lachnospiraceae bacterium]
MELLVLLQKIRNPILDYVCMFFTLCGQDAVLMLIFCTLYWCKDKTYAMRVGLSFISSALIVQTLKIICVVPRPWMLNSSIKPVEMAKKGASGYSFPSGHTQSATSIYATIAWNSSKSITKVGLFFLILLVAFSRLYLGVHTPLDVTSSLVISILVVVGINTLFDSAILDKVKRDTFFAI